MTLKAYLKKRSGIVSQRERQIKASMVQPFTLSDIIRRDGPACYLCGANPAIEPMLDHVQPLTRGAVHTPLNCRVACMACNQHKGKRLLSEL